MNDDHVIIGSNSNRNVESHRSTHTESEAAAERPKLLIDHEPVQFLLNFVHLDDKKIQEVNSIRELVSTTAQMF